MLDTTPRMRMLHERSHGCRISLTFDGRRFEARAATGPQIIAGSFADTAEKALDGLGRELVTLSNANAHRKANR